MEACFPPFTEAKLHILEMCMEVQLHEDAYAEYYFGQKSSIQKFPESYYASLALSFY